MLDTREGSLTLDVQSNVSSPIRSHPAIHAQRTGSSAHSASMPSQPLVPDLTGEEEHARAGKDDEEMTIEPDLCAMVPLPSSDAAADG